jgi:murein DD-endopeptidase MepM/ murein hydrolase activator NlpD
MIGGSKKRLQIAALPASGRWLPALFCLLLALTWMQVPETTPLAPSHNVALHDVMPLHAPRDLAARLSLASMEIVVRSNDTLDAIFRRVGLSLADLATLRFDPGLRSALDRLYPGELLTIRHHEGELMELQRRLSPSETLHIRREQSGFVSSVAENPLEIETRTARAVIDSSLFQAADAAGISDTTALAVADIFAWDIDFALAVQPGDSFTVTYERQNQDGEFLKDGPVLAVEFHNGERTLRAVRYVAPDGTAHYYTPDGRNLRKAFIRTPVEFTRISSRFSGARFHPILNRIRAHKGVDYAAPTGTPVHAAGSGRVAFVGQRGGYGNVVELTHANGVSTVYGHLSRFGRGLRRGMQVEQSQVIGYVGMTGLATGPHLHYEYRVHGVHMDPMRIQVPNAEPLPADLLADFLAKTGPLVAGLQNAVANPVLAAR